MLINVAVGGEARVAEGATRGGTVRVEHQEVRVVEVRPTVEARVAVTRRTSLARVLAVEFRPHDEVVELVDVKSLSRVSICLDHETVAWLVVDGILDVQKLD